MALYPDIHHNYTCLAFCYQSYHRPPQINSVMGGQILVEIHTGMGYYGSQYSQIIFCFTYSLCPLFIGYDFYFSFMLVVFVLSALCLTCLPPFTAQLLSANDTCYLALSESKLTLSKDKLELTQVLK